jgi:hypothetical protein
VRTRTSRVGIQSQRHGMRLVHQTRINVELTRLYE